MRSGVVDAGGAIRLAGCQRAHGAGGAQVEQFGEFDAAFRYCGPADAMAFGNVGHGIPGVDQAADQSDAFCR